MRSPAGDGLAHEAQVHVVLPTRNRLLDELVLPTDRLGSGDDGVSQAGHPLQLDGQLTGQRGKSGRLRRAEPAEAGIDLGRQRSKLANRGIN